MPALAGGVLIGAAAVLLMGLSGRIAGISGMIWQSISPATPFSERLPAGAFVAGLLLAPWIASLWSGSAPVAPPTAGIAVLATGGLLVGLGVSLANGCTSGHGVCGLSRLSQRSAAAVAVFMSAAILTVAVQRWTGMLG